MNSRISTLLMLASAILVFVFEGCTVNNPGSSSPAPAMPTITLTENYNSADISLLESYIYTGVPGFYDDYDFITNISTFSNSQKSSTVIFNQITYPSSDDYGQSVTLSGCFFFNTNNSYKSPIVLYTHGTELIRTNVPSYFTSLLDALVNGEPAFGLALSAIQGWTVVMPDYQGMGFDKNEFHPYCVARQLGISSADALQAVINYVSNNHSIGWNGQVFVIGYSEGGYVALAAVRELQKRGIKVDAAVVMEGPYDLTGAMVNSFLSTNTYPYPYFLPYFIMGYNAVYGNTFNPYNVFLPQYSTNLVQYTDGWYPDYIVTELISPVLEDSLQPQFVTEITNPGSSQYLTLFSNNLWTGWAPATPMEVIHCISDDCVTYSNFITLSNNFGGLPNVTWLSVPPPITNVYGTVHGSVSPVCFDDAVCWLFTNEK